MPPLAGQVRLSRRLDTLDPTQSAIFSARSGRAFDRRRLLMLAQLPAPVGQLDDLAAQLLDGHAELLAVALDRLADLLR